MDEHRARCTCCTGEEHRLRLPHERVHASHPDWTRRCETRVIHLQPGDPAAILRQDERFSHSADATSSRSTSRLPARARSSARRDISPVSSSRTPGSRARPSAARRCRKSTLAFSSTGAAQPVEDMLAPDRAKVQQHDPRAVWRTAGVRGAHASENATRARRNRTMYFLIVSGMSGAGKSRAVRHAGGSGLLLRR